MRPRRFSRGVRTPPFVGRQHRNGRAAYLGYAPCERLSVRLIGGPSVGRRDEACHHWISAAGRRGRSRDCIAGGRNGCGVFWLGSLTVPAAVLAPQLDCGPLSAAAGGAARQSAPPGQRLRNIVENAGEEIMVQVDFDGALLT